MKSLITYIITFIILLSGCASKNSREERILDIADESVSKSKSKYDIYMVDSEKYTTNGKKYHDRYYKYLVGIAAITIGINKMNIRKNSIGFYFDKKKNVKNELYLGLDVMVPVDPVYSFSSYTEVGVVQLKKYLTDVLFIIHSCKTIFKEDEVIGIVVGMSWIRDKSEESINIWIDKKDVFQFENNKLTFNEVILRNTITNINGKIINLPI